MVSKAFKCSFQFISRLGSIPLKRKISRSSGAMKSNQVFSPLNTLAMYFPSGIARATVAAYMKIIAKYSVFIRFNFYLLKFFGFKQYVDHVNKHGDGHDE